MVMEAQDVTPDTGASEESLLAQYEQEYRNELSPPADSSTPDASPPDASTVEQPNAIAAPDAPATAPADSTPSQTPEETPQQRERRFQAEADRVLHLFNSGRAQELTQSELAKAREIARHVVALQPDVVEPIARQVYDQGRQEAERWSQIAAYHQEVTNITGALRQGEIDATDAENRLRQIGFQNMDQALWWKTNAERAYAEEQQRAAQPDLKPVRDEGFREGVMLAGDAFLGGFRELEELKGIADTEWLQEVDKARREGAFPGVVKMVRDKLYAHWEKQAKQITAQAAQQAREQTTTELLQTIPSPDLVGGAPGTAVSIGSLEDADRALHSGQINLKQWEAEYRRRGERV